MNTPAAPRLVLLLKSGPGSGTSIAHKGGYALYGVPPRWRKITADKPAPKGAPVAAHPKSAGHHEPAAHFTDEQWAALKLPDSNVNAGTFNGALEKLKAWSDAGDVTAIVGSSFGVNTYGVRLSKIANTLLGMHGSAHTVTPGQKAGTHAASQVAEPADPHPTGLPEHIAPKAVEPAPAPAPEPEPEPAPTAEAPTPAAESGPLTMPAFEEGKTTTGAKDWYEKLAQKVIDHGHAGNASVLEDMKADGMKPNAKGKVSHTWAGKTANSKKLIALHAAAVAHAKGEGSGYAAPAAVAEPGPVAPAPVVEAPAAPPADTGSLSAQQLQSLQSIPWFKLKLPAENTNAKSHNAAIAKIEAMAFAGDAAGLKAFVSLKSAAKQTYAKKQVLTAQTALAALGVDGATAAVPVEPAPVAAPAAPVKAAAPAGPVPAAAVPPMEASTPAAGKVYVDAPLYENTIDGHNKFWSVSTYGSVMTTKHGKIGTKGKDTVKTFSSPEAAKAEAVKLQGQKKAKGYQYSGFSEHTYGVTNESGPKEGDTKQGADGMLVLKDGHWVKVGEDLGGWSYDPSDIGMSGAQTLTFEKDGNTNYIAKTDDGYQVGLIDADGNPLEHEDHVFMADVVNFLKKKGFAPPVAALQKLDPSYTPAPTNVKKMTQKDAKGLLLAQFGGAMNTNSSGKMALKAAAAGDAFGMVAAYNNALAAGFNNTAKKIKFLAETVGVSVDGTQSAPTSPVAPPAPAAPVSAGGMLPMDGWSQTGGQGGSNPGGKFKDPTGQEWYCKFPKDADTAKSEILAAKLYALAGLSSQDAVLVTKDGKVGIASKWVDIKKAASPGALAKVDGAQAGFAVDAWLGNWDVVGLAYDNLQIGPDGKAHRVDAGGSLEYRAQGEKKAFGPKVDELDTLMDAGKNHQTASVFQGMTKADLTASAAKVLAISDVAIRAMVNQHGPGDAAAKAKLADTLIARKKDIAAKFPAAAKKKKAPVFKPESISAPPSFLNWGGGGKSGPSSKEFLNKANDDAVQAIFAAAKTGDADAVKKLTAPVFDKDTGAVTGHKPVLEHPSQHVKGYAQQAVNEITYQLNPPKQFRFDGGHPLHSLNAAYPAHKGSPSSAVAQKLGKFLVLGEPGVVSLADVALPAKITHSEGGGTLSAQTYAKQAQAAIAKMPSTQKQAVKSYTGGSYGAMNGSLWDGNPSGAAKAAGEALKTLGHDIAPGTVLSRQMSLHGQDLNDVLGAVGKVLQEPAIMSTSIRPSSWVRNVQFKLHVGPGVKGLWVGHHSLPGGGALSIHSNEDEMILPPGTRLLVLNVRKGGKDADGFGAHGQQHVIEAIILPTE